MDEREGMSSFYLSRGVGGSGSNAGSGNQGGGLHVPPGFKNESNPNISPHSHSNMRVASSMGSSFNMEQNPPPVIRRSITMGSRGGSGWDDDSGGGGGTGGGGGGTGTGGGATSIVTYGGGTDSVVKKKRGRPRKYAQDGSNMVLGLTPAAAVAAASPEPVTPTEKKIRGRPRGSGWKQRLANVGEWMHDSAGLAFTPHIIHVLVGEDVAAKILSFAQQRPRALCVLSGNGAVSAVTLRQFTPSGGAVTYEGRFEILCLSGSYILAETGGPHNRTGGLSISVCSSDGQVIGGAIGGRLIASTPVQVVVCSFVYGGNNSKPKAQTEENSSGQMNETSSPVATSSAPSQRLTSHNPVSISWPQNSRADMRNSHTEIDLTRG